MDTLKIDATTSTPEINFDPNTNILNFSGKSYPENVSEYYGPVFKWLDEYIKSLGDEEVSVNMELIYFNSSSSKVLMDFFDLLEEACENGKKITVNWIFDAENDSAQEFGEEFQEDVESLKFNLVQKD